MRVLVNSKMAQDNKKIGVLTKKLEGSRFFGVTNV